MFTILRSAPRFQAFAALLACNTKSYMNFLLQVMNASNAWEQGRLLLVQVVPYLHIPTGCVPNKGKLDLQESVFRRCKKPFHHTKMEILSSLMFASFSSLYQIGCGVM